VTDAPTWGPNPDSVAVGNWTTCIDNGTDPLTGEPQTGRYSEQHGDPVNIGYKLWEVENNWDLIRNSRTTCRCDSDAVEPFAFGRPNTGFLFSVSPNPFNPKTRISILGIQQSNFDKGLVRLAVFTIQGKRVGAVSKLRQNQIEWDGHAIPSGLYFAQVTAPGITLTKSLLLLK